MHRAGHESTILYMNRSVTRRGFVAAAGAASLAAAPPSNGKLALLGGTPVRTARFPSWPRTTALDEREVLEVLRSGRWFRGGSPMCDRFEQAYAKLLGAPHCLATANGTSALFTSLNALGVGPGNEVIVPPYTFVATVNVVLLHYALPVFVDTDPETFQIDAGKVEASVTGRTAAILPVHIAGSAADLDTILAVGRKRSIPVVEDACQAHLGEWRGKRLGTLGAAGCFSFQVSKNLPSGEGGAIVTADAALIERCFRFHSNGRGRRASGFSYETNGANLRMTEFQAALLLAQMTRLEEQSKVRDDNAAYLTALLKEIPGLEPARLHEGCTRSAWHIYMMRYSKEEFAGVPRQTFLKALQAEGVPCSGGYRPLNREPFLKNVLYSKAYRAVFSEDRLKQWEERNQCPANDRVCEEAVWFGQTTLLGTRRDMDQIAEAIRKIRSQADALRRV
jgi:dTDP-4-amino-4,6-dideoxygalactose transaminase